MCFFLRIVIKVRIATPTRGPQDILGYLEHKYSNFTTNYYFSCSFFCKGFQKGFIRVSTGFLRSFIMFQKGFQIWKGIQSGFKAFQTGFKRVSKRFQEFRNGFKGVSNRVSRASKGLTDPLQSESGHQVIFRVITIYRLKHSKDYYRPNRHTYIHMC